IRREHRRLQYFIHEGNPVRKAQKEKHIPFSKDNRKFAKTVLSCGERCMVSLFARRTSHTEKSKTVNHERRQYIEAMIEQYKNRLLHVTNVEACTSVRQGDMRLKIEQLVSQFMSEEKVIIQRQDKDWLISWILDESVGFGPLEPLIADESIT